MRHMCAWTGSILVQVMACRRFGAETSPEPMLDDCQVVPKKKVSVKVDAKCKTLHPWKYVEVRTCISTYISLLCISIPFPKFGAALHSLCLLKRIQAMICPCSTASRQISDQTLRTNIIISLSTLSSTEKAYSNTCFTLQVLCIIRRRNYIQKISITHKYPGFPLPPEIDWIITEYGTWINSYMPWKMIARP